MKKIFLLFILLLTTTVFTQTPNWTGVKETNINVSSAISVDIFTNSSGNHIIVQENNILKYYKMNINGTANEPIQIEGSAVASPSICGDDDNIYIVYGTGSQVKVKRSTNGGSSWSLWSYFNLTTSASLMESVFSNHNLHITYLESGVVKYRYRNSSGEPWSGAYNVSTGESGTNPRITARCTGPNYDYVYFLYGKSNTDIGKWRSFEVTHGNWGTLYSGYQLSNVLSSNPAGFRVTDSRIIFYYSYRAYDPFGSPQYYFDWIVRDLNNNYISSGTPNVTNLTSRICTSKTYDDIMHNAFFYLEIAESGEVAIRRSNSNDGYPDDIIYNYTQVITNQPAFVNISATGNEVHAIWQDEFGNNNGNNLRYKFDNQSPIPPQNLTISAYNDHPKLNWDRNPDADIDFYRIYKSKGGSLYQAYATVPDYLQEYVDNNETICNPPPGWECNYEEIAGYKITAVDKTDPAALESDYSDEVKTSVIGSPPHKAIAGDSPGLIYEYKLYQNYPNPFNPSTSINYQVKDRGFVSLKVYDMLGREVAVLVNEIKEQGQYSVIFNAANLPSGVYICSLRVNDFVQNNKMTLMK